MRGLSLHSPSPWPLWSSHPWWRDWYRCESPLRSALSSPRILGGELCCWVKSLPFSMLASTTSSWPALPLMQELLLWADASDGLLKYIRACPRGWLIQNQWCGQTSLIYYVVMAWRQSYPLSTTISSFNETSTWLELIHYCLLAKSPFDPAKHSRSSRSI